MPAKVKAKLGRPPNGGDSPIRVSREFARLISMLARVNASGISKACDRYLLPVVKQLLAQEAKALTEAK